VTEPDEPTLQYFFDPAETVAVTVARVGTAMPYSRATLVNESFFVRRTVGHFGVSLAEITGTECR
jgi:hypothetical protein